MNFLKAESLATGHTTLERDHRGGWKLARAWSLPSLPISLWILSGPVARQQRPGDPGADIQCQRGRAHREQPKCDANMPAGTVAEEATISSGQRHFSGEMLMWGLEGQTGAGSLEMGDGARERGWTPQETPSREAGGRQPVTAVRNWGRASAGLGSLLCKCEEIRGSCEPQGACDGILKHNKFY